MGMSRALRTERQARMRCGTWCPRADWKANLPAMTSSAGRAVVCWKLAPRYCLAPGVCEQIAFARQIPCVTNKFNGCWTALPENAQRSEEHTSELHHLGIS